jgi:hypothetical protein
MHGPMYMKFRRILSSYNMTLIFLWFIFEVVSIPDYAASMESWNVNDEPETIFKDAVIAKSNNYPDISSERLWKVKERLRQDRKCLDRDSNRATPEHM